MLFTRITQYFLSTERELLLTAHEVQLLSLLAAQSMKVARRGRPKQQSKSVLVVPGSVRMIRN